MGRNAPLAMACRGGDHGAQRCARGLDDIRLGARAGIPLHGFRSLEQGDFLEGIRAAIIDKDRNPRWRHAGIADLKPVEVSMMLTPLGPDALTFD